MAPVAASIGKFHCVPVTLYQVNMAGYIFAPEVIGVKCFLCYCPVNLLPEDYAKVFLNPEEAKSASRALQRLEDNWTGPILQNQTGGNLAAGAAVMGRWGLNTPHNSARGANGNTPQGWQNYARSILPACAATTSAASVW